jgi:hypothetical protein
MFRQVLNGGVVLALLLAHAVASAPASAQQSKPQPPAPAPAPVDVKAEELQKFSNAMKQLQNIEQQTVTQMRQVVKTEGLSEERFMEIYRAQQEPNARSAAKITPKEQQLFEQASTKLGKIQEESQKKMVEVVNKQGLDIQRFNQILAAVRQNPELQKKVQQMLGS